MTTRQRQFSPFVNRPWARSRTCVPSFLAAVLLLLLLFDVHLRTLPLIHQDVLCINHLVVCHLIMFVFCCCLCANPQLHLYVAGRDFVVVSLLLLYGIPLCCIIFYLICLYFFVLPSYHAVHVTHAHYMHDTSCIIFCQNPVLGTSLF